MRASLSRDRDLVDPEEHPISYDAGGAFLALASSSTSLVAGPKYPSFWENLKRHLTELTFSINDEANPTAGGPLEFDMLGMLTNLKVLGIRRSPYIGIHAKYHDLSGKTLVLNLPHFATLELTAFEQGKLILSCPRLAIAHISWTKSLHIMVEDATLVELTLYGCEMIRFAIHLHEDQWSTLKTLKVRECTEVERHLIEDVGQMTHLQVLDYMHFPASRMPRSFPQRLEKVYLQSLYVSSEFGF